jgi:hypothetical protein
MNTVRTFVDSNDNLESENIKALVGIFEQINVYNEIGFQTIKIALITALDKIKSHDNRIAVISAIEQLNKMMDRCRSASEKIDKLTQSGSKIVTSFLNSSAEPEIG